MNLPRKSSIETSGHRLTAVLVTALTLISCGRLMAQAACPTIYTLFYTGDTKGALNAMEWKEKQYRMMGCPPPLTQLRRMDFRNRDDLIKYLDDHPVDYLVIVYQQNIEVPIWQPLGGVTGDVNMTVWGPQESTWPRHCFTVYRKNLNGPIVASTGTLTGGRFGPAGAFKLAFKEVIKDAKRYPPGAATSTATPPIPTPSPSLGETSRQVVAIRSTPDGADITVDGKYMGSTPSTVMLAPGDHTIKIEKAGFTVWERTLTLSVGGKVTVDASLEKP
jgi:hypothetical protein